MSKLIYLGCVIEETKAKQFGDDIDVDPNCLNFTGSY